LVNFLAPGSGSWRKNNADPCGSGSKTLGRRIPQECTKACQANMSLKNKKVVADSVQDVTKINFNVGKKDQAERLPSEISYNYWYSRLNMAF
jgi:hypothetical protein